jgi:hypothetical protein
MQMPVVGLLVPPWDLLEQRILQWLLSNSELIESEACEGEHHLWTSVSTLSYDPSKFERRLEAPKKRDGRYGYTVVAYVLIIR